MTDPSKEKVYAERQDDYKQKKEEIFKEALKDYHEPQTRESTKDDENKV